MRPKKGKEQSGRPAGQSKKGTAASRVHDGASDGAARPKAQVPPATDDGAQGSPPPSERVEDPVVVGLGASAGGLEALQVFFEHMPANAGPAFVIVTHQPPNRSSLLRC